MVNRPARRSRRKRWRNNTSTSGSSSTTRMSSLILVLLSVRERWRTRQNNSHFGELGSRIDLYRSRMLLHDDVVSDGQAKASAFPGRLRREEGIEHLFPDLGRNAGAVVANRDLYAVAEAFRRSRESGLIAVAVILIFAFGRRIEAVGDQVQESPGDLLRKYIDSTGGRIEGPLHIDLEALLLGAGTVIGEIKALLDQGVDIDQPMFSRSFARV